MVNLSSQFKILENRWHALITPIDRNRLWEITLPILCRTNFARTSLVLRIKPKLSTLMDNGSVSNGNGFQNSQLIRRQLRRLRIRYRLVIVSNRFTACQVANGGSKQLLVAVSNFVKYLLRLNRIMENNV